MPDFLVDMQPLVLSKQVHICSSKSHELSCGYLIHSSHQLFSIEKKHGDRVLTRQIIGKIERPLVSMIARMIRSKASVPMI